MFTTCRIIRFDLARSDLTEYLRKIISDCGTSLTTKQEMVNIPDVQVIIIGSVMKCDVDIRNYLYNNIAGSGDITILWMIAKRSQKEIIALASDFMTIKIIASPKRGHIDSDDENNEIKEAKKEKVDKDKDGDEEQVPEKQEINKKKKHKGNGPYNNGMKRILLYGISLFNSLEFRRKLHIKYMNISDTTQNENKISFMARKKLHKIKNIIFQIKWK